MLNRTMLYLTRKKGKSFTLFILLFLISTFVTTSLALMYTTNEVSRVMRASIDARFEIWQLQGQPLGQEEDLEEEMGDPITRSNIDQMVAIAGISQYNAQSRGLVTSEELMFRRGLQSGETDNMGGIQGTSDSTLLSDFSGDRLTLAHGRHITAEDRHVVMISETLANENNLSIGDTITLQPGEMDENEAGLAETIVAENAPSIDVQVIGIYTDESMQTNSAFAPSAFIATNQMFSDHHLLTELGLAKVGEYEVVTFFVQDPSELPRIISEVRQLEEIDWDGFFMQHDDGDYMRIAGDLQTVQNLLLILLMAIGLVSAMILALILILRMRGRVHEVGILLSVGIGKKQIWGGFLLEISLLAIVAFVVSYVSSGLIVPTLNQRLLADLPSLVELGEQSFQSMPLGAYVLIYLLILLVILPAAFVSTQLTIRLKPKQILSKMS